MTVRLPEGAQAALQHRLTADNIGRCAAPEYSEFQKQAVFCLKLFDTAVKTAAGIQGIHPLTAGDVGSFSGKTDSNTPGAAHQAAGTGEKLPFFQARP